MTSSAFQILKLGKNASSLEGRCRLPATSSFFAGHFPDKPVLPAVGLLTILDHMLSSSLRDTDEPCHISRLRRVKFRELVETGGDLLVGLRPEDKKSWYEFTVSFQGKVVSRGHLECQGLSHWHNGSGDVEADTVAIDMDSLIPQRPPMRILDDLLDADNIRGLTVSTVTQDWPALAKDIAPGVFLIEAIAQTAALHTGWLLRNERTMGGAGYLVGIPEAELNVSGIAVGTRFHTEVTALRRRKNFAVYQGSVSCGGTILAKASIQAFKPDDL